MDQKQGWVALLQQRLNNDKYPYQVVNASISGDTTHNGLVRLPDALRHYQPTITIIELGGNDGLLGLQLSQIKNNLINMITLAKRAGSRVLVLGVRLPPNYGITYDQSFQQIFAELAKREGINVVPLFLNRVDNNPKLMQQDGIHPTADAQIILLNNLWPTLEKLLK